MPHRWLRAGFSLSPLFLTLDEAAAAAPGPRGRLSDDQRAFIGALEALGHSWALVRSIEDARDELARLGVATREVREMARA
jgi:hypothetical protein